MKPALSRGTETGLLFGGLLAAAFIGNAWRVSDVTEQQSERDCIPAEGIRNWAKRLVNDPDRHIFPTAKPKGCKPGYVPE